MRRLVVPLTLVSVMSGATLFAQTRPKPQPKTAPPVQTKPVTLPIKPPEGPEAPKDDKDPNYYPYGKYMFWISDPTGRILTLKGDAQIFHKDAKFLSDTMLYNEDNEVANAPGKLRIEDPQNTVTGDSGVAYIKKALRYADLVGDVTIVARPKPEDPKATTITKSTRKEFKSPVTITCDKLRYWWKQKRGFSDANVKISFRHKEKDWVITAASLEYFGETERALLKGSVLAVNDKGEKILADTADVILKEGAEKIVLEPVLKGTVIKGDPDDDEDGKAPPPPVKPGGKGEKLTL